MRMVVVAVLVAVIVGSVVRDGALVARGIGVVWTRHSRPIVAEEPMRTPTRDGAGAPRLIAS